MYSRRPYSSVPYSAVEQPATAAPAAVTPVFSEYARPITSGLTAAVIATTIIGFVAPPPAQAAVQPTPVFSAFEQPAPVKTAAHQQASVVFNIAPSIAAAFTGFSDFGAAQPARAPQHEQSVRFEIGFLGPAKTPDRLTFSDFGQPSKPRPAQDGFANAPQPLAVQAYVFGKYDQPPPKKPPLFDSVQFTIQPPIVAAVSQAYVFSAFSQPPPVVRVSVHQQPQPAFEVTQVILAVTPSPLVFTQFSQPAFSRTYKVEQHPEVRFRILRPDAATPGPGIFPPFEQPAFARSYPAHQQPSVSYALATPQPAAAVVVGGDFADFDFLPKPSRAAQQDFTNAPQPPAVQNYVFAPFSQPLRVAPVKDGQINFEIGFLGPASTPDRLVFSEFAQPKFSTSYAYVEQPNPLFEELRPGDATPGPLSTFSSFGTPSKAKVPEGFTNAPQPATVQNVVFGPFEQPQVRRAAQQDFVQFTINPPTVAAVVQPYVFLPFDLPVFKRAPQFDVSVQFQIFPPVVSVVTFTGFSAFGAPQSTRRTGQDFTNAPIAPFVQTYVFSPFDQPRFGPVIQGEHTSPLFEVLRPDAATPGPGIFPAFEQPKFSTAFPAWQQASVFFEIVQPPPPPASSGPVFSPFEQPHFYKITYQGDWISFEVPFQGTVPPTTDQWSGKPRKDNHHTGRHRWKKIKLIDELEELIAELNKLAKLSPKQIVKAPAPVILARYPQPLADALFDLEQKQGAKAIKASVSRAQAEAEYQLALQQEEDDDDAAFLLLM